ncbi:MAG: exonuclease domain-containing protein [Chloroflexota bacterium]|nr:exonuclease domain-containing protein [Chloroflexota bacterium]MDE2910687.1 exonuclease domain-containing protein [Chloroflexota bacterium]
MTNSWADTLSELFKEPFVVFDVETTGLDPYFDEIVSFSAVLYDPSTGSISSKMDTLIAPRFPEKLLMKQGAKSAYDINGIHPNDLVGKPSFENVFEEIAKFLEDRVWVCWNIDFDSEFIDASCEQRGYEYIQAEGAVCAMRLVTGGQRAKLTTIAESADISIEGAHNSLNDVIMTLEVLKLAHAGVIRPITTAERQKAKAERQKAKAKKRAERKRNVTIESASLKGLNFVVTGTMSVSREEIELLILSHSGQVAKNVSGKTNYLVVGEKPGSKINRAIERGVRIINEEQLRAMINSPGGD